MRKKHSIGFDRPPGAVSPSQLQEASIWPGFSLVSSPNSGLPTVRHRLGFSHPPQIPIKPTWGRNIQQTHIFIHTHTHTGKVANHTTAHFVSLLAHTHTHNGPWGQQQAVVGTDPTRPFKLAAIISTCNHKSTERRCKQTAATDASSSSQQEALLKRKTEIILKEFWWNTVVRLRPVSF